MPLPQHRISALPAALPTPRFFFSPAAHPPAGSPRPSARQPPLAWRRQAVWCQGVGVPLPLLPPPTPTRRPACGAILGGHCVPVDLVVLGGGLHAAAAAAGSRGQQGQGSACSMPLTSTEAPPTPPTYARPPPARLPALCHRPPPDASAAAAHPPPACLPAHPYSTSSSGGERGMKPGSLKAVSASMAREKAIMSAEMATSAHEMWGPTHGSTHTQNTTAGGQGRAGRDGQEVGRSGARTRRGGRDAGSGARGQRAGVVLAASPMGVTMRMVEPSSDFQSGPAGIRAALRCGNRQPARRERRQRLCCAASRQAGRSGPAGKAARSNNTHLR